MLNLVESASNSIIYLHLSVLRNVLYLQGMCGQNVQLLLNASLALAYINNMSDRLPEQIMAHKESMQASLY